MQINKIILGTGIASIITIAGLGVTALACHPQGAITKQVQNITEGGALQSAHSATQAVAAKPGDTLKYVVTIANNGAPKANGDDDMTKTVMTDTLPVGVSLISNPGERSIVENIGTIKPGQSVSKEYLVTVTNSTDSTITNTACYTGVSINNDNAQHGCDTAVVTVTVPVVTPPVATPPVTTPSTPVSPTPTTALPVELPHTGPTATVLTTFAVGIIYFMIHNYIVSRRQLHSKMNMQS